MRDLRAELKPTPAPASRRRRRPGSGRRGARAAGREALAVTEDLRAERQEKARQAAERDGRSRPCGRRPARQPPGQARRRTSVPKEPRVSTTDAEARVMKMADGGFRPAYNVQFAGDTASGAIAEVSVDNVGSDMGKMAPMSEALAGDYGQRPRQHLADGGFAKLDDITALAQPAWKPSCRCPTRATPSVTGTRRCPATRPRSPRGGSAWAPTTPRRSTRNGPRRWSAPTPRPATVA